GLHTVVWNYQGQRPVAFVATALSPSERRDSILRVVRAPMVLDSLSKAHYDSTSIAAARGMIAQMGAPAGGAPAFGGRGGGGGGGGGRGGGGGQCERPLVESDPFCPRPAEQAGGGRGGGGAGGQFGEATTTVTGQALSSADTL